MACGLLFITMASAQSKWSANKAKEWYAKQGWLKGSNFQPSTAINQLEMFQAETFDTAAINRELGWAQGLGFNVMRVYLHHSYGREIRKDLRSGWIPTWPSLPGTASKPSSYFSTIAGMIQPGWASSRRLKQVCIIPAG